MKSPLSNKQSNHPGYHFWALTGKLLPGLIALVVLLLYIVPSAIEVFLIRRGAWVVTVVIIGDLAGCAVLSVVLNIRWALYIYLTASGIEFALLRYGGINPGRLMWITDLFPVAIIAALVVYAACRGRNWRRPRAPSAGLGDGLMAVTRSDRKLIAAKRVVDVVLSGLALLVLLPLLVLISATVWLVIGPPIFFLQVRPGHQGKLFQISKFRSMSDKCDDGGRLLPDEHRLGWFGRFLRGTSLDEFPELWNVLKGEMSLVGPRPLLVQYLPLYTQQQRRRHEVKPGITGWAQIHGRNALNWEQRFELDVWYVDNWSLRLDIRILWLTLLKVWQREGISQKGHATMPAFMGSTKEMRPA